MNPATGSHISVTLKARGDEFARNGDFVQAIRYYQKAIELDPLYAAAWNNLGYSYANSGMHEDAKRCREKIRQLKAREAKKPEASPSTEQYTGTLQPGRAPVGQGIVLEGSGTGEIPGTFWRRLRENSGRPEQDNQHQRNLVSPGGGQVIDEADKKHSDDFLDGDSEQDVRNEIEPPPLIEENPHVTDPVRPLHTVSTLFSGLKSRITGVTPEFPKNIQGNDISPGEAGQDTAREALHMEGGEVYRFQGGRSVCTIQNCGKLVEGFDRVLEQNPCLSAGFRGIALYSLGRYNEALDDFDRELEQDPGATGIWILRAWVLTRLGRDQDALYSCEQALNLDQENFDAWRQSGFVLQSLGREREALHSLDRALSLNPHSAEVWVARGRILHILFRDHEALQSYDRALAIDPRSSDLWLSRARSLSRLGREEEALTSLEQGIAANPDNPSLFICQGRMFHALGKFGEALTAYDRALTIRPDDARTWEAMGGVLRELGKNRDEAAAYDRALAIDPGNTFLSEKRGDALALSGQYTEAAADFRKALESRPGDMTLVQSLGMALANAGRTDEAREVFRPVMEASPDGIGMMKARGEAFLSLKHYREALDAFREALSRDPDDEEARQGARAAEAGLGTTNAERLGVSMDESPEEAVGMKRR